MSFPRYVFHTPSDKAIKLESSGRFIQGNSSALLKELASDPSDNVQFVTFSHHLQRIQLELLLNCNLQCLHCYSESGPGKDKGLSFNEVCRLIDQAHEMGVLAIDLTGGEPLLRPDLFDIIRYIRSKGMFVSIFTNGTLLTDKKTQELEAAGVQFAQVSIDGFSPATHDVFRQKQGAFTKALRAIHLLRKTSIKVKVNIVVNKKNLHEIKPLTDFLEKDLQVTYGLDRLMPAGRAVVDDEWALEMHDFYRYIRQTWPTDAKVTKVCDSPTGLGALTPTCGVGAFYMYIKYDGQGVLCPTMTPSESPEFSAHSIPEHGLRKVWEHGESFKKYRDLQCRNINICPVASECRGGCRSNAYLLHGAPDSPDELNCNIYKNSATTYVNFIEEYKNAQGS